MARIQPVVHLFICAALIAAVIPSTVAAAADPLAPAYDAYLQGRYAQAEALLRAYLAGHPRSATGWTWLGAALTELDRHPEAVAAFAQAYRLRPSYDLALWLGAAYAATGRDAEARRYLTPVAASRAGPLAATAGQWLRMLQGRSAPVLSARPDPQAYARVVRWYNSRLTAAQVDAIVRSILYYSLHYGVDPRLVVAVIGVESGFRVTAQSPAGAYGLGQLMPATWQAMGVHPGDPVGNIYATVRVLKGNLEQMGGNLSLALAAYNAGKGAVRRYAGIPPYTETRWYVYNVLAVYRHLAGG